MSSTIQLRLSRLWLTPTLWPSVYGVFPQQHQMLTHAGHTWGAFPHPILGVTFITELLSPTTRSKGCQNRLLKGGRQVAEQVKTTLATNPRRCLSGLMPTLPMFPLGSVLFPGMPLALRVFEERYLKMMGAILEEDTPQFGVVLIERGHEVGGGEKRFDVGTIAEVLEIAAPDGPLAVMARGTQRFRVTQWLEDDPYPRAEVELLDPLESHDSGEDVLQATEDTVRDTLRYLDTVTDDLPWSPDIDLSPDWEEKLWQLAGISPLGPLDHQDFLTVSSMEALSTKIQATVSEALEVFRLSQQPEDEEER